LTARARQRERLIKPYGATAQLCRDSAEPRHARLCAIGMAQGRQTMRGNEHGNTIRFIVGHCLGKTAKLFAVPCSR